MNIYYIALSIFILIWAYLTWRFSKYTPEVKAFDWGYVRWWLKQKRLGAIIGFVSGIVLIILGIVT